MFVYEYLTAVDCERCSLQKCRFAFAIAAIDVHETAMGLFSANVF